MEERIFTIAPEQMEKFHEWRKSKTLPQTTIGGAYTFCFTSTSLGDIVEVRCVDGTKLELTDYDNF